MTDEFTWGGEVYTYNPTQSWEKVIFADFALGLPIIMLGVLVWSPFMSVVVAALATWLVSEMVVGMLVSEMNETVYSAIITSIWFVKNGYSFAPGDA